MPKLVLAIELHLKSGDVLEFTVRGAKSKEEYSVEVNYDGLIDDLCVSLALTSRPPLISTARLKIDPVWDPIRDVRSEAPNGFFSLIEPGFSGAPSARFSRDPTATHSRATCW